MLQSLLADRFKLKFHRETPQRPVYQLAVAKGGPKIVPMKEGNYYVTLDPDGTRPAFGSNICGSVVRRFDGLRGYAITIAELIEILQDFVGRSVIDKTGFKGRFDVDLKFDSCNAAVAVGEIPPASSTCADPSSYSSISAGLQEQLGLRLQSTKGPVEVLIIDHAEKPTAN